MKTARTIRHRSMSPTTLVLVVIVAVVVSAPGSFFAGPQTYRATLALVVAGVVS